MDIKYPSLGQHIQWSKSRRISEVKSKPKGTETRGSLLQIIILLRVHRFSFFLLLFSFLFLSEERDTKSLLLLLVLMVLLKLVPLLYNGDVGCICEDECVCVCLCFILASLSPLSSLFLLVFMFFSFERRSPSGSQVKGASTREETQPKTWDYSFKK